MSNNGLLLAVNTVPVEITLNTNADKETVDLHEEDMQDTSENSE